MGNINLAPPLCAGKRPSRRDTGRRGKGVVAGAGADPPVPHLLARAARRSGRSPRWKRSSATRRALSCAAPMCGASSYFQDKLWPVIVDVGQFSQVIQNLVINADQAMPDGGDITITTENAEIGPESGLPLQPGRYVKISVRDTGIGIPPENSRKYSTPISPRRATATAWASPAPFRSSCGTRATYRSSRSRERERSFTCTFRPRRSCPQRRGEKRSAGLPGLRKGAVHG